MNQLSVTNKTAPKVLVLASRDYDVMNKSGRARIFRNYLRFLSENADVTVRVAPMLSFGGWLGVAFFFAKFVRGLFNASRPLQVTFVNAPDLSEGISWDDFDVVLVDGPRLAACILDDRMFQEAGTKLIVDMDDLMSRRYQVYSDMGLALEVVKTVCSLLDELRPSQHANIGRYEELITFVKDRPGHDVRYAIDASKIERGLGWRPQETFESGLRKTVEWYLSNEAWWQAVLDGSYQGERLGLSD